MIQKVDEMTTPPVIGKYYLVPTVRYNWDHTTQDWPVLGPKHDDAEIINFPWPHFHHDSRFQTARQFSCFQDRHYDHAIELTARPLHRLTPGSFGRDAPPEATIPHGPIIYRRMMCKREAHLFTMPDHIRPNSWPEKLRKAYAGSCLQENYAGIRVCPHKGAPLDTLLPVDGIITCPLHGLRFDAVTGKSVS